MVEPVRRPPAQLTLASPSALTDGVLLVQYVRQGTLRYAAITEQNQELTLSPRDQQVLDEAGLPMFINNERAYYQQSALSSTLAVYTLNEDRAPYRATAIQRANATIKFMDVNDRHDQIYMITGAHTPPYAAVFALTSAPIPLNSSDYGPVSVGFETSAPAIIRDDIRAEFANADFGWRRIWAADDYTLVGWRDTDEPAPHLFYVANDGTNVHLFARHLFRASNADGLSLRNDASDAIVTAGEYLWATKNGNIYRAQLPNDIASWDADQAFVSNPFPTAPHDKIKLCASRYRLFAHAGGREVKSWVHGTSNPTRIINTGLAAGDSITDIRWYQPVGWSTTRVIPTVPGSIDQSDGGGSNKGPGGEGGESEVVEDDDDDDPPAPIPQRPTWHTTSNIEVEETQDLVLTPIHPSAQWAVIQRRIVRFNINGTITHRGVWKYWGYNEHAGWGWQATRYRVRPPNVTTWTQTASEGWVLNANIWGDANVSYEFRYAYQAPEPNGRWSHWTGTPHLLIHCVRYKPRRPTWTETTRDNDEEPPSDSLLLDFEDGHRGVSRIRIQRRLDGGNSSDWRYWAYDTASNRFGWFSSKHSWELQFGLLSAYRLPATTWGEDGNTYEFRVQYLERDTQAWSDWSDVVHIVCVEPIPDPPTIVAPDAAVEHDPDEPIRFTVRIPAGQTATRVRLRRHEPGSMNYEHWNGLTSEQLWQQARSVNAAGPGSFTGDVHIELPADWQTPGATLEYDATYTTSATEKVAYGEPILVTTDAPEIVLPEAPTIEIPEHTSTHRADLAIAFTINIPAGEIASRVRLRRNRQGSTTEYEYWLGNSLTPIWASNEQSPAIPDGLYTTTTTVPLTANWQPLDESRDYQASYRRAIDSLDSPWSQPATTVNTPTAAPPPRPTWIGSLSEALSPDTVLDLGYRIPAGQTFANGTWLRRRETGSLTYEYRNGDNTNWVATEDEADVFIVDQGVWGDGADGQNRRYLTLSAGFQVSNTSYLYEVAYRDQQGVRSEWSRSFAIVTAAASTDAGVVLAVNALGQYRAFDFGLASVSLSGRLYDVLNANGFPSFIYNNEAFYLQNNGNVVAHSLSTATQRVAHTQPSTVTASKGLAVNDTTTQAFLLERNSSHTATSLVRYDLPNFTNRTIIESATTTQAPNSIIRSDYITNLHIRDVRQRMIAVTDNYAYLGNRSSGTDSCYAVPLNGSATHLFSHIVGAANFETYNDGTRTWDSANDRVFMSYLPNTGGDIFASDGTDAMVWLNNADRIHNNGGNSNLHVEATRWYLFYAQNPTALGIGRLDVDGTNPQQSMFQSPAIREIRAYRPHNWQPGITIQTPAAPTWIAPADDSDHDPTTSLLLDWANGNVASDRLALARRLEGSGEDGWQYWGLNQDTHLDWVDYEYQLSYQTGLVSAYELPSGWGTDGQTYEFRVRWRNTNTLLLSDWSTPRIINAVQAQGEPPTITAPAYGSNHPHDQPLDITITLPRNADEVYLRRFGQGQGYRYWNGATLWLQGGSPFSGEGSQGNVIAALPADWQAPNTEYTYEAAYTPRGATTLSRWSSGTVLTTHPQTGTGDTGGDAVTGSVSNLEERTPYAPTWQHELHLSADSGDDLTLRWNRNARYVGQRQTAYRIRREQPDGAATQYLSATGSWENASQTIVSTDEFVTLESVWQGVNTVREYFVRVRDEGGRWSTYSSALRVDTDTEAARNDLRITSPVRDQQVGQFPVVTWAVENQVAYQLRTRHYNLDHDEGHIEIWQGEWQAGADRRGTAFIDVPYAEPWVGLEVRVRDQLGRVSDWTEVLVLSSEWSSPAVPAFTTIATTAGAILIGLAAGEPRNWTHCVIHRRYAPTSHAQARALGVSEEEVTEEVKVFDLSPIPYAQDPSAVEDFTVRRGLDYEYRLTLRQADGLGGWLYETQTEWQ